MSIAEFSSALKNKAIKEWFNNEKGYRDTQRKENINTLVNPTSMYRSAEETANKNSFVITKDTIRDLLSSLKGYTGNNLEEQTEIAYQNFSAKNVGVKVNRRKISIGTDAKAIYFSSISFDSITNLVNNILNLKSGDLATKFEKGHVVGLNTELLRITANRVSSIDGRNASGVTGAKEIILKELNNVINYYKQLDYDSANIQPADNVKIYASVNKTISKTGKTKYLVEIQPKESNQKSADEVKRTIGSIRKLFDPGALTEAKMSKLIDELIPKVSDPKFVQDLLNMKSSPDFIQMITNQLANSIVGKQTDQNFTHTNVKIGDVKIPKVDLSVITKLAKNEKAKLESLVRKLKTKVRPVVNTFSLLNLQLLLNRSLQDLISANMGDGQEKRILNYRTGRFASSAKVERLSVSREGMVTAFYSYMKNPYQTFEPGYRQGSPKTRDPKLLIAQSIREIAATRVTNRMRAVLI